MSEAWLLSLVLRYPHPTALARKAQNGAVIAGVQSLECRGFVRRCRDRYRLTRRGRAELRWRMRSADSSGVQIPRASNAPIDAAATKGSGVPCVR